MRYDPAAMPVLVNVPSALRSYTAGAARVQASGATVGAVLADLEPRAAGLRFRVVDEHGRIRPHIRFFLDSTEVEDLAQPVRAGAELHIVCALSGG
jgi:sulfur-carrier protein